MSGYQVQKQSQFGVNPIYPLIAPCQTLKELTVDVLHAQTGSFNSLEATGASIRNLEVQELVAVNAAIDVAIINTLTGPATQVINELEFKQSMVYPQTDDVYNENWNGNVLGLSNNNSGYLKAPLYNFYQVPCPLGDVYEGTELYTGADGLQYGTGNFKVYGYDSSSGTVINLDGGNIYTEDFNGVTFNVNAPSNYYLSEPFQKNNKIEQLQQVGSYYQARGYASPNSPLNPAFETVFAYSTDPEFTTLVANIYINPVLDESLNIVQVQLACGVIDYLEYPFYPWGLNPDFENSSDYLWTWFTFPVVNSYDEWISQNNASNPVVYYDPLKYALHFNLDGVDLTNQETFVNSTNTPCFFQAMSSFQLTKFIGSFAFVTRDPVSNVLNFNGLVPSALALVQISPEFTLSNTWYLDGEAINTYEQVTSVLGEFSHSYNGTIITRKNFGLDGYDLTVAPFYTFNGATSTDDEFIWTTPTSGINPNTAVTLQAGTPSTILDLPLFGGVFGDLEFFTISVNFLNNPGYPEDVSSLPPDAILPYEDPATCALDKHEYSHSTNYGEGVLAVIDTEAHATAHELDQKLSLGSSAVFRARAYARNLLPLYRAQWQMGFEAYPLWAYENPYVKYTSYGFGMFHDYVARRMDLNRQVMRRSNELIASTTLGPLLNVNKADPIDMFNMVFFSYNAAGTQMAYNQALEELCDTNLTQVWKEYAVAVCLLRNNLSIPYEYRMNYPYWIYSAQNNIDIQAILAQMFYAPSNASYAYFWDDVDSPTGAMNNPYTALTYGEDINAESLYPSWPRYVEGSSGEVSLKYDAAGDYVYTYSADLQGYSLVTWVMQDTFTNVHVTANTGAISVNVVKFSSDGGNTGTFSEYGWTDIANGDTEDIDLSSFAAQSGGYTKLIIVNTQMTDNTSYGPLGNFQGCYYDYTGNVTVTVDF